VFSNDISSLDDYFSNDLDLTQEFKEVESLKEQQQRETIEATTLANQKEIKKISKNKYDVPSIYFKQPDIYTIYTREEIRSIDNIDIIINRGWKSVIVGDHQLVINDEYKLK